MLGIENYWLVGRLSALLPEREEQLSAFGKAVLSSIALTICAGTSNQQPLLAVGLQTYGSESVELAKVVAIVARIYRKGGKGV